MDICPRRLVDSRDTFNGDSDHNMIRTRMRYKNMDLKRGVDEKRVWLDYSKERLKKELEKCGWSALYRDYDINRVCHYLTRYITRTLDKIAPITKLRNTKDTKAL